MHSFDEKIGTEITKINWAANKEALTLYEQYTLFIIHWLELIMKDVVTYTRYIQ